MIQFGHFIIDKTESRLFRSEVELQVEPKLYQLLLLFIENPDKVIDRETIVERLWSGRYVTDNAINKQVANLRKLLDDDPKNATYIQTVPKLGYRLICPINEVKPEHSSLPLEQAFKNTSRFGLFVVIGLLLTIVLAFMVFSVHQDKLVSSVHTKELTRHSGLEFSPRAIPQTDTLLYLRKEVNSPDMELWQKAMTSGQANKVDLGDFSIFRLVNADYDQESEEVLVYLVHRKLDVCEVYRAELKNNALVNGELLLNCAGLILGDVQFDNKTQKLFYTARVPDRKAYQVYSYDVKLQQQALVHQPPAEGMGNHAIDLSPDSKRLLILSADFERKTKLHVLDLQSNELTLHQKFDRFATEVTWYHDSEHIYYFAPPPSNQILLGNLDGSESQALVSVSDYISHGMTLLNDGESLLFSTRQPNYNNQFLQNADLTISNSTVYDILPTVFHNNDSYMFISKRSGKSQLYLADLKSGEVQVLSGFNKYHVFRFLQVSPDDKSFVIATQNKAWHFKFDDIADELITLNEDNQVYYSELPITNIEWLSEQTIAVKALDDESSTVLSLDDSEEIQSVSARWKMVLTDHTNTEQLLLVEKATNTLFKANRKAFITAKSERQETEVFPTKVQLPRGYRHLKVYNGSVFFIKREESKLYLHQVALSSGQQVNKHLLGREFGFDVAKHGVMVSQLESMEGDIHRTVSTK